MTEPSHRKKLNADQKDILIILYKFRYATRELVVNYLGLKSSSYTYYRLNNLVDQKLIGKRFTPEDKINRKPAVYFLLPEGINALKTTPGLNQKALANISKDRNRSQSFQDRCLMTLRLYIKLRELYKGDLEFYSKSELSEYTFFPKNLPDGYLTLKTKPYLLEWLPATTTYAAMRGCLTQLTTHFESGLWEQSGTPYPCALFICENPYIERQIQRIARRSVFKAEDIDFDDMPMFTTTTKALFNSENADDKIWTEVEDTEDPIGLTTQDTQQ